jgi:serine/threonine protein kinase
MTVKSAESSAICYCHMTFNMCLDEVQGHGRAVDWWAFGVLIYEMLAGYPPFYEEDTAQTYQRILHGRFTFPSDFPVTVRDLVRKLLQVCNAEGNTVQNAAAGTP